MAKSNYVPIESRLVAEFVGTLFFVFIAAGSVVSASYLDVPPYLFLIFVALSTGIALSIAVSMTMNISGGHLNPAVTLAMYFTNRIKMIEALFYVIAQILGAVLGSFMLFALFPLSTGYSVSWGTPGIATSALRGTIIEAMLTFILVVAIFGTAVDERAPKIGGFGIGLAVMLDALIGGPLTGAAMNPARYMGPAIASLSFANWYVYWIGPVIGATLAAFVYSYLILNK